ncbi:MAG TPA: 4-hydroxybenzoate 3-monooxygenase, partial [Candidatus Binataceae bacterium]|nr:4-hydroxybenzoate 3-monooxygenase [Candidatus Binataceae bacterium]
LHLGGVESAVVENRSRAYVQERVRAGVLEQGTVDLMNAVGVGERLRTEGLVHRGIELRFGGRAHRIDLSALTGGSTITIYPQAEVVKDLTDARLSAGLPIFFEAAGVRIDGFEGDTPRISFQSGPEPVEVMCEFIAGCDGSHGVCRPSIPADALTEYARDYPFAWLGILAEVTPSSDELIYCLHDRGFALHSMRSPELTRLYLQCAPDEDLARWADDRIWSELRTRFALDGWRLRDGPIIQKGITPMRSLVVEPMQYGRLFLAGDAAHIVPPTGAKGLNLAVADVRVLARALIEFYRAGTRRLLDEYSATCLRRVWKVQRFSWWMTSMLHRFENDSAFDRRRQLAELDYVTSSESAARSLAENYVGLPFD